jgi:ferredoxin
MSVNAKTQLEIFLNQHDEDAWNEAVKSLLPHIHEVDKTATQIWFAFFPLSLQRALEQSEDPQQLARKLLLQGKYRLQDQIDSSHQFLYGHRYWPHVKKAIEEYAATFQAGAEQHELASTIREVAGRVAEQAKKEESLLVGITAVALMTLQQVGILVFKAAPGTISLDRKHANRSPEQILRERAKDDSQGPFGFLRTVDKVWTVTFDENDDRSKYKLINSQDLAWAAAADKRDYRTVDPRRIEGPIPVECRNAACGTCWVGVLGGAEKLGEVSVREERKMKEFGYIVTDEAKPLIRLACVTTCHGAVSIVIPPWNGVFGKFLQAQKEAEESVEETQEV